MQNRVDQASQPAVVVPTSADEFVRLVTALLPQIIRLTDSQGRALYLNAQWQRYTGLDPLGSLGLAWQDALHPDDRPRFLEAWAAGVTTDADFIIEYRLRRADGAYRWFESHAVPAIDDSAIASTWVSSLTDIDARRQAEHERDAVLGAIAHDLRSPLTTLIGRAQLVQRRLARLSDPAAPALAADLGRLVATGQHMATMVAELADLARLSHGATLDLDLESADLAELVREAVADAQQIAPDRLVRLDLRIPTLVGDVDAPRVRRVVANLVGNALKYSESPSPITVTLDREEQGGKLCAVLGVRDEGIGIPAADLPRVVERFYRATNAVGRAPGTGIGLAGVKQIVEQHGGTLQIASSEGQGTTVTVRLPLTPASLGE